ncbi:MAG: mannose-1-phosphate guanylyltransferase [Candidatus Latescibacterota bacterium]
MFSMIMAGGVGKRFWPKSRRRHPKQLLDLTGQGSMIELTVNRLKNLSSPEEILIITNHDQCAAIGKEIAGRVPPENIIGEPDGRNTAPAIGLGALLFERKQANSPMLVLPADHIIEPIDKFENAIRAAYSYVSQNDALLTFGIRPTRPDTGYGYIHTGEEVQSDGAAKICRVQAFLEKPDAPTAQRFVEEGTYFWNSGMFLWRTSSILGEIRKHLPELHSLLSTIDQRLHGEDLAVILDSVYSKAPRISIDYGIMERADNVAVLEADFHWNDAGSWEYIRDIRLADADGNVIVGEHILIDSCGNTIISPDRLVGLVGIQNLVVVDGGDSILICRRDRVQDVQEVVERLKRQGVDSLY